MQYRTSLLSILAVSASIAIAAPSTSFAQGQPTAAARQEAGRHFRTGVDSFQRGDYASALAEFQSAYRIAPHHSVRVNIANCFMRLGRPIDALNHFESFIAEAMTAGGIPAQQRREVEAQITELRGQVAEVQVRIDPVSVRDPIITVDGTTANTSGVLRMMPGRHQIEVSADGYATARQDFNASAGQRADVSITMRPPTAATTTVATTTTASGTGTGTGTASTTTTATTTTATTTTAGTTNGNTTVGANAQPIGGTGTTGEPNTTTSTGPTGSGDVGAGASAGGSVTVGAGNDVIAPPQDTRRGLPMVAFIGAAAGTGAFAIAWGVTGGLALGANGEFNTIARRIETGTAQPDDVARGEAAARNARTLALVSDVMMGVTIAGAVATTVIAFNTRWRNTESASTNVAVVPMALPGGGGLAIGGSL